MSGAGRSEDVSLARQVAEEAGRLLLELRSSGPVGKELGALGDRRSNELILARLGAARPSDAVLSEEAADDSARLEASRVWIVDPLDGTREYSMGSRSDWAVHVALWARGAGLTAAAVALPARAAVHSSAEPPPAAAGTRERPLILVSDSRPPAFAPDVAAAIGADLAPMGSAGAKAMAVYRGEADAYLHAGGQWEWDSAAPVGVLLAGGYHCSRIDGSELLYNQAHPYLPDLVVCRPELAAPLLGALSDCGPTGPPEGA